jgi:hypothetical protein
MPTTLRRITIKAQPNPQFTRGLLFVNEATHAMPEPGDVFYAPHLFDEQRGHLSPHYWEAHGETHRPPIVVVLPTGQWWCVDELTWTKERGFFGMGWKVTGSIDTDPMTLTVTPSIRSTNYHGTLTKGVLSDDLDIRDIRDERRDGDDQTDAFPPD